MVVSIILFLNSFFFLSYFLSIVFVLFKRSLKSGCVFKLSDCQSSLDTQLFYRIMQIGEKVQREIVNIFLSISLNIRNGCAKKRLMKTILLCTQCLSFG